MSRVRLDQRTVEVSDHLCECGCGLPTMVSPKTRSDRGWVKGQPRRFRYGHGSTGGPRPFKLRVVNWPPEERRRAPGVLVWVEQARGFETPCWIWKGGFDKWGYGKMKVAGRQVKAHRVAFERAVGPIPVGHDLHHLCEVRLCVRPDHLVALTPAAHAGLHLAERNRRRAA